MNEKVICEFCKKEIEKEFAKKVSFAGGVEKTHCGCQSNNISSIFALMSKYS